MYVLLKMISHPPMIYICLTFGHQVVDGSRWQQISKVPSTVTFYSSSPTPFTVSFGYGHEAISFWFVKKFLKIHLASFIFPLSCFSPTLSQASNALLTGPSQEPAGPHISAPNPCNRIFLGDFVSPTLTTAQDRTLSSLFCPNNLSPQMRQNSFCAS